MRIVKMIITTLFALIMVGLVSGASLAQSQPAGLFGHVTVNGAVVSGVQVSLSDGRSVSADSSGFYQFGISNGSTYTVTASYDGHTASSTFTAHEDHVQVNLNIAYSTSPKNGGGSSGSSGSWGYGNPTVTPTPAPTATAVPSPSATITPTPTPTPTPLPPTATPLPPQESSFSWWWILLLLAIIAIAGVAYYFYTRRS